MTTGVSITVDKGIAADALTRIEREATAPLEIMRAISGYLLFSTQQHFKRETGPDGKWKPLSAKTARKKRGRKTRGYDNILVDKGALYASLIGDETKDTATVGSNDVKARIHQLGGIIQMPERTQTINLGKTNRGSRFVKADRVRKRTLDVKVGAHVIVIPKRSFLYLNDEDNREIIDIVSRHLDQAAS
jgi:phage virion morphogenesis protein